MEPLKKMYSIDINKVIVLQDDHWKWFWNRAEKKTINLNFAHYGNLKFNCKQIWKAFFGWNEDDLKKILFASQEEMFCLIDENSAIYKDYKIHFKWMCDSILNESSSEDEHIKKIENIIYESFGYKDFVNGGCQEEDGRSLWRKDPNWKNKRKTWNAYTFTKKLELDVCPYCGRQYTFTLGDGEDEKNGRPQIDHYFPEAEYPFLSCSLYNFIPSCSTCNHQKSDQYNNSKKIEWKSLPYIYEDFDALSKNGKKKLYDDVKFKAFYQFLKDEYGKNTNDLCYSIKLQENGKPLASEELKNANSAFHLVDLYNMHELELDDLFTRYRVYNKSRLKNVLSLIHSARNSFNANFLGNKAFFKGIVTAESCRLKNVVLGFPLGGRDRQYPLKKFKEDIVAQLDETCKKMKKR